MITLGSQIPWHESVVQEIKLLAAAFDRDHLGATADNTWKLRLEAKAETLANLIRCTKTPKDIDKILAAWTEMKKSTGLEFDFGVTEYLECILAAAEHIRGNSLQFIDGKYELWLVKPSTSGDRFKFEAELAEALKYAKTFEAVVWWRHNGVQVSTDWARSPGGAWARFTEVSAEMAN